MLSQARASAHRGKWDQLPPTALYWSHIYSDILQNAPFRSQIFTIFFASGARGHLPPNQNLADALGRRTALVKHFTGYSATVVHGSISCDPTQPNPWTTLQQITAYGRWLRLLRTLIQFNQRRTRRGSLHPQKDLVKRIVRRKSSSNHRFNTGLAALPLTHRRAS